MWGQDNSGTLEGAAGVGGLLRIKEAGNSYQVGYDGNGNVIALVNAGTGNSAAYYEYDAFGITLKATGAYAKLNPFRFSTKYTDGETSLVYFGYRYYQPQTGRWLSRDPIGEQGGVNLNVFVSNNPVSFTDTLGLFDIDVHYYLTYYLARKAGCFKDWESSQIAEGDLRSDEDAEKKPGSGIKPGFGPAGLVLDERQIQANKDFHAFGTHEQNTMRANELYRGAVQSGDLFRLGTYLHFLQDEFSHYDFAGNPVTGQLSKGNSVDHTNYNPAWSMEMAMATWEKLKQYGKNRGCRCLGEMTDADWRTVKEFIDVGYDLSTRTGRVRDKAQGVSNDQLRRKVDILGIRAWRSPNLR